MYTRYIVVKLEYNENTHWSPPFEGLLLYSTHPTHWTGTIRRWTEYWLVPESLKLVKSDRKLGMKEYIAKELRASEQEVRRLKSMGILP